MSRCLRFTALLAALAAAAPLRAQQSSGMPTGTASISGHVFAGDTGKPIRGAVVEIVIYENLSSRFRQVLTDADGKFEFKELPAGHFQIAAQATRYLRMQYGQQQPGPVGLLNPARTIELIDGQPFTTADFTLSHYCAIEGVVLDEFGDPVPNAAIQVSQSVFANGRRRLGPTIVSSDAGPPRPTDDQGHFRIGGLAPGEYYVEAVSGAFADPNAAGGFAVTFYPGTTKASAAKPVVITPGHDVLNLTFALTPAAMARVSGTLVDAAGRPVPGGNLVLFPSESAGMSLFAMVRSVTTPSGTFVFRNLPPGTYTVQAYGVPLGPGGNLASMSFGYQTFTVDGHDLDQLAVKIPEPRTLRGRITFEDGSPPPSPGDMYVGARPVDFDSAPIAGGPAPMTINDDFTFEVKAMSGLRLVSVASPSGWILKRVTLNGLDVTDTPLDLREHDVNGVEIVMTKQVTTVTGAIIGADQQPANGYSALLFSTDQAKWTPMSRWVAVATPGQNHTFTTSGLPLGTYTVVAIPSALIASGEWQDPQFLSAQAIRLDAQRVVLFDGQSATVRLTVK